MSEPSLENAICPVCGRKNDAATAADGSDHIPSPGDVSICFKCTAICSFNEDFSMTLIRDGLIEEGDIKGMTQKQLEEIRILQISLRNHHGMY